VIGWGVMGRDSLVWGGGARVECVWLRGLPCQVESFALRKCPGLLSLGRGNKDWEAKHGPRISFIGHSMGVRERRKGISDTPRG
jgi:hypothetical protein